MSDAIPPPNPQLELGTLRRTRIRRRPFGFGKDKRAEIAQRVIEFATRIEQSRVEDKERRLQRYAKFRMWTADRNGPWDGASDQAVPDMMEGVLNMEDTLHNAVMSARPAVVSRRFGERNATDTETERNLDRLIDFQVFVEQPGEQMVSDYTECFVRDPSVTAYTTWVRERRKAMDVRTFGPLKEEQDTEPQFRAMLKQALPDEHFLPVDEDRWDWKGVDPKDPTRETGTRASFYTRTDGMVELLVEHEVEVYDGPRVFIKKYDEVLYPPRAANLQMPTPTNPNGAPHVILVDHPTVDEIARLQRLGTYDLLSAKDVEALEAAARERPESDATEERERQTDAFEGTTDAAEGPARSRSHHRVTRYTCFDLMDVDGDGVQEDVVWWVIREQTMLCRARLLSEVYPARTPRRPFAEASFLPVKDRKAGISFLEILEGLHDWLKSSIDKMMDYGDLASAPWFAYRATSSMKPETLRPAPGEGIPLSDPQRDIHMPQFQNQAAPFYLNVISMIRQLEERLSMQGDLQSGRVPPGRSAALRTFSSIQTLLGQSSARPERILRRYFMGFVEIWKLIHELDREFLPDEKQILATRNLDPGEKPVQTVRRSDFDGRFEMDFHANVQNASRQALYASMSEAIRLLLNPLMLQLGIVTPDGAYRMVRDTTRGLGIDPEQYLQRPTPSAALPRITAEQAMLEILQRRFPQGVPAEGARQHLLNLQELLAMPVKLSDGSQGESIAVLDDAQIGMLRAYQQTMELQAVAEAQQQALLANTAAFAGEQQRTAPAGANGSGRVEGGQPQVSGAGELLDETLPGAGGGGNA